jgi:hypothetical protein
MQHDDSASLTMEGVLLSAAGAYERVEGVPTAKVVCAEAYVPAGWHNISIQYASRAGQARHHLRMSLHNPLLVEERYPGRFVVHYENAGAHSTRLSHRCNAGEKNCAPAAPLCTAPFAHQTDTSRICVRGRVSHFRSFR